MNILREQRPYVFHPPRYSPWLAPLLYAFSAQAYRRRKFKIRDIAIEGVAHLRAAVAERQPVLVAPNHADHADPHVLLAAGRKADVTFHFMAAREGFERGSLAAFALQHIGVFSIDREGADVSAIKTAMAIMKEGRYPLVIFPEGEIYHHHERLDELNEGAAKILLRSAGKDAASARGCAIPTALRYVHDPAVADTFSDRLGRLEHRIAWKPRPEMDVVERIYRLGRGLLALKEEEYLGRTQEGPIVERIQQFQHELVALIERRHGEAPGDRSIPERVKALRSRIRKRLTDEQAPLTEAQAAQLYDDLEALFIAVQLYSYPGRYLSEQPSVDRIAETILKLEEDVLGEGTYPCARDAHVVFGEPIDVGAFLRERNLKPAAATAPLTALIADRIQSLLSAAG